MYCDNWYCTPVLYSDNCFCIFVSSLPPADLNFLMKNTNRSKKEIKVGLKSKL